MNAIAQRLARIRQNIAQAALAAGRSPDEITLVAATKTQSDDTIRQAIAAVLSPGVPPRGIPSVPMPRIGSTSSLSAVH